MSEELKPCPFCGGMGRLVNGGLFKKYMIEWQAECSWCNVHVPLITPEYDRIWWHDTKQDAITAWNTRTEAK